MSPAEALDLVEAAFPGLRAQEIEREKFLVEFHPGIRRIQLRRGRAIMTLSHTPAMLLLSMDVVGEDVDLTGYRWPSYQKYPHATFEARLQQQALIIDALARCRRARRKK